MEILRAARVKGIMPADRPFPMPQWLLEAISLYPDDASLICMAARRNPEQQEHRSTPISGPNLEGQLSYQGRNHEGNSCS